MGRVFYSLAPESGNAADHLGESESLTRFSYNQARSYWHCCIGSISDSPEPFGYLAYGMAAAAAPLVFCKYLFTGRFKHRHEASHEHSRGNSGQEAGLEGRV